MFHLSGFVTLLVGATLLLASFALVRKSKYGRKARLMTRRLGKHLAELKRPGYLPPPPTVRGQRRQYRVCRFLTWLIVGRVKVEGLENLSEIPEGSSYQITPNHSHYADVFVMPVVLPDRGVRYMADPSVMGGAGGLLGLFIGPMGAFAASHKTALTVLTSGQPMVVFPEGWTYLDGEVGVFRRGAVYLCRACCATGKQSVIVPTYIKYGRYPGAWIKKLPIRAQYALLLLAFPYFRKGATVVIGKPVHESELVGTDKEASAALRLAVLALKA